MGAAEAKAAILANKTALGIEFGSTRIKAVLVDDKNQPIASGGHEWENRYENGVWTYSLDDIWTGIQDCYQDMAKDVKAKYDVELESVGAFGVSAMMHGYMPFNKEGELLVPFRTWRNNITGEASEKLMEQFNYNIPQRWSIAHLYQAILNGEEHVKDIDYITTLEAYVHWKLTGKRVLGIGDAAGMFPIDTTKADYNQEMIDKFDELVAPYGFSWKLRWLSAFQTHPVIVLPVYQPVLRSLLKMLSAAFYCQIYLLTYARFVYAKYDTLFLPFYLLSVAISDEKRL